MLLANALRAVVIWGLWVVLKPGSVVAQIVCFVPYSTLLERILIRCCIVGGGDPVCPVRPMKNEEDSLLGIKKEPRMGFFEIQWWAIQDLNL